MATIKDVAKEAGVSIATVSRVINKSPKASQSSIDVVTQAMTKLGYRPNAAAKALVSQSTNTVGVLVSDVSDPFFGTLIKAVDTVAENHGKHILIGNGYHDADKERRALDLLINSRCDALVIHAKGLSDEELISYAKEVKSMVIINRHIPELANRCISLDNYKGAYLATEFLIRHGHRQIACLASSHNIEDAEQRIAGYQAALEAHNINLNNQYIEYGEPNSEGGETAMTNLMSKSVPFTGVVAYNDYMAAGALSVLDENGLAVPRDVSLVGFDDGLIAKYIQPRLTTVRYPIQMMAEKAAELAISLTKEDSNASVQKDLNSKKSDGKDLESKALDSQTDTIIFSPTMVRRDSVLKIS